MLKVEDRIHKSASTWSYSVSTLVLTLHFGKITYYVQKVESRIKNQNKFGLKSCQLVMKYIYIRYSIENQQDLMLVKLKELLGSKKPSETVRVRPGPSASIRVRPGPSGSIQFRPGPSESILVCLFVKKKREKCFIHHSVHGNMESRSRQNPLAA